MFQKALPRDAPGRDVNPVQVDLRPLTNKEDTP